MSSRSTQARTRCENSPGESSAASICSMNSLPASRIASRSMPSPLARANSKPSSSSKTNSAARSPRDTAAAMILQHQQRFAGAGGPDDQRARSRGDAAAEQRIERGQSRCCNSRPVNPRAVFGRDQAREDCNAVTPDDEIVIAAAERLAAAFDDAQAPPFAAVDRSKLIEMDDAMGDAVHRAIGASRWSGRRA